jgi:hypothetical protein
MPFIPLHRFTGGALVRASVFSLERSAGKRLRDRAPLEAPVELRSEY